MRAIVESTIRVLGASEAIRTRLRAALTFENPEHARRVRLGKSTWNVPPTMTLMDGDGDGSVILPRGAVRLLRACAAELGEPLEFVDRRGSAPRTLTLRTTLRDYQDQAARALVRRTQGIAVLPCGAGKSLVGLAAIALSNESAMVIVHTRDLVEQWKDNIRKHLGVEPGVLADRKYKYGQIVVATVQSLAKLSDDELRGIGHGNGCVVVDECHHIPASMFRRVIDKLACKYRFGLTATPERTDGLTPLVELCLGSVVYTLDHARLIADGHLVVPEIVRADTERTYETSGHTELVSALVADEERNNKLLSLVEWQADEGRTVLVLSGRVEHCEILAARLSDDGYAAAALTSSVAANTRAELLQSARSGKLRILCATSLADEGLDLVSLDCLVLATPSRAEGRTIQRLGRLMRPCPSKQTPRLFDLVDDAPMARRQWHARLRAYRQVLGPNTPVRTIHELLAGMREVA